MIWQVCVRCSAPFRDQQKRNWCHMCWMEKNPTPATVTFTIKPKRGNPMATTPSRIALASARTTPTS